jgi:hypothetical protein
MKRYSTLILRLIIFIAGMFVLALCGVAVWLVITEPNPASDYYILARVFLAGTCLAAIPCLIALYQALKLLGYIDTNRVFSDLSVKSLKIITRAALADFLICAIGGMPFFYIAAQTDDAPGLMLIGMVITGMAFVIFVFTSVLNRLLQEAISIKMENDLTV